MEAENTQEIPTAHVAALLNRAHSGMLIAALADRTVSFVGWRAYAKALTDLQRGHGQQLAAKDARSGGYQAASCVQAAWARLPVGIELLSLIEVQQFLASQGVKITTETIPELDFNTAKQFNCNEVSIFDLNNEHASAMVDVNDGPNGHLRSFEVCGVDVQAAAIVSSKAGAA